MHAVMDLQHVQGGREGDDKGIMLAFLGDGRGRDLALDALGNDHVKASALQLVLIRTHKSGGVKVQHVVIEGHASHHDVSLALIIIDDGWNDFAWRTLADGRLGSLWKALATGNLVEQLVAIAVKLVGPVPETVVRARGSNPQTEGKAEAALQIGPVHGRVPQSKGRRDGLAKDEAALESLKVVNTIDEGEQIVRDNQHHALAFIDHQAACIGERFDDVAIKAVDAANDVATTIKHHQAIGKEDVRVA